MKVILSGSYRHDKLQEMLSSEISHGPHDYTMDTARKLEALHIVVAEGFPSNDTRILYRALIFPILRQCPCLKSLTIATLKKKDVAELSAILRESCPFIEVLKFYPQRSLLSNSIHQDPDEQACTDLVLSCPRLRSINGELSGPWTMTKFVPRVLEDPHFCQKLEELHLNTVQHPRSSEWIQQLLCSAPNLRVFKQYDGYNFDNPALLNIRDLVRSRWICNNLEVLHLALGCTSFSPEDEAETGVSETLKQRTRKIHQVYEQFGALTRLQELRILYISQYYRDGFDMSFKAGLKAMEPCLPSLKLLDIFDVEGCRIGTQELEWLRKSAHGRLRISYK
ncbi:hypothetical protein BG000_005482 [Podila horticola]|nr:hypothetical protein BG000_005482 [Podila horticola]